MTSGENGKPQPPPPDVVLVHDYLNQPGGAERVVLEMAAMWPSAPIYTSLYRPQSTFPEFGSLNVRTTFLDKLPVDARFRNLFPLYPPHSAPSARCPPTSCFPAPVAGRMA